MNYSGIVWSILGRNGIKLEPSGWTYPLPSQDLQIRLISAAVAKRVRKRDKNIAALQHYKISNISRNCY